MKRGCKALIAFIALLGNILQMSSQTDAQYTQYFAVPAYYNPAVYGNTDNLEVNGAARLQWVGIESAPKDFYVGAGMPIIIADKHRTGAGIEIYHETIGLYRTFVASAQISYKIPIWDGFFSIGLQPGLINQSFKGSDIYIPGDDGNNNVTDDPDLPVRDLSGSQFDIGAGIWFSRENWWVGISGQHLFSPSIKFKSDSESPNNPSTENFEFKTNAAFYLMTGGNIPIKNTLFEIRPSVLFLHYGNFNSAVVTALVGWRKIFSAGISYRWNDAVSFILSADIGGVYVGYSYDYPTSAISRVSNGSHELVAGYRMKLNMEKKNKYKRKSIRLM